MIMALGLFCAIQLLINCIDNYRFAYVDDETAMFLYHEAQADGCCGGFDEKVLVNGKEAMIGCNYGH